MTDRLIDLKEVMNKVSLRTTKIYELIKQERFPKPIKLGRLSRWPESQVSAWIEQQKQTSQAA